MYKGNVLNFIALGFLVVSIFSATFTISDPARNWILNTFAGGKIKDCEDLGSPKARKTCNDEVERQEKNTNQEGIDLEKAITIGQGKELKIPGGSDPCGVLGDPAAREACRTGIGVEEFEEKAAFNQARATQVANEAAELVKQKESCLAVAGNIWLNNACQKDPVITQAPITPPTPQDLFQLKSVCLQEGGFWANNSCSYNEQDDAVSQIGSTIKDQEAQKAEELAKSLSKDASDAQKVVITSNDPKAVEKALEELKNLADRGVISEDKYFELKQFSKSESEKSQAANSIDKPSQPQNNSIVNIFSNFWNNIFSSKPQSINLDPTESSPWYSLVANRLIKIDTYIKDIFSDSQTSDLSNIPVNDPSKSLIGVNKSKSEQTDFITSPEKAFEDGVAKIAESYTALTLDEVKSLAANLGIVGAYQYDWGANLCGPLSAEILKTAGLYNEDINDLYLFNPDTDMWRLATLFPNSQFTQLNHLNTNESVGTYNWEVNSLQSGDFIYLDAGSGDSFEHMLVVSRVDNQGRVYSTTNYTTDGGNTFIVDEVLLYDPNNQDAGMFHVWTDPNYKDSYGNTGNGGFLIVRALESTIQSAVSNDLSSTVSEDSGATYNNLVPSENFTYYNQTDDAWQNPDFNCAFSRTGCAITIDAMLLSTYTNQNITPIDVKNTWFSNPAYDCGSYYGPHALVLEAYDFVVEDQPIINIAEIKATASYENPIVLGVTLSGPGDPISHWTIAVGTNSKGELIFEDPFFGSGIPLPVDYNITDQIMITPPKI